MITKLDYYSNPDNDGNIILSLWNTSDKDVCFTRGHRIAQGIFRKYEIVDNDEPISRERAGGIGSTGK